MSDITRSKSAPCVSLAGLAFLCIGILTCLSAVHAQQSIVEPVKSSISMLDSTREQDGLFGPVRRIHTEMSRLNSTSGKVVEEPRMLLEVTTYDPQGKRIWNVYYPVNTGAFKGNQEFAYDEQGHVKEMTLRDDSGRILSREAYTYEYDNFGNWTKMTSSLVIFEGGKVVNEPFEVTSRAISYYFDDSVAKILKSPPASGSLPTLPPVVDTKTAKTPEVNKPATNAERETTKAPPTTLPAESIQSTEKTVRSETVSQTANPPVEKKEKSDVNVSSDSPVQAYQIPPAPKATTTQAKLKVSGGVVNGKILRLPKPVYPPVALTRKVVGKVVVEVTLDEKGQVVDARALAGNPLLIPSAVSAARMARFEPTLLSGQPVKATRLINFEFNPQ